MEYRWSASAVKQLRKLERREQLRVVEKLDYWIEQPDPLRFGKYLTGSEHATYRFRVGSYRILVERHSNALIIIRVGDRKDVYR